MSQAKLPLRIEPLAEVIQLESGALVLRPRVGRKLNITLFARTAVQVDGSILLTPLCERIEMHEAVQILGIPYSTLRRLIEMEAVKAFKRSPGRWVLDLQSVLTHKELSESDPEYWDNLKPSENQFQGALKL